MRGTWQRKREFEKDFKINTVKKYRILSLEAESLVHSQMVGDFSAQSDGKPNVKLFTGILDYSLESERLREVCDKTRTMSEKTYFSKNGYDYTTAIINVKFEFTRHDFVKIDGVYVREGYGVSAAFSNSSEVREGGWKAVSCGDQNTPIAGGPALARRRAWRVFCL